MQGFLVFSYSFCPIIEKKVLSHCALIINIHFYKKAYSSKSKTFSRFYEKNKFYLKHYFQYTWLIDQACELKAVYL